MVLRCKVQENLLQTFPWIVSNTKETECDREASMLERGVSMDTTDWENRQDPIG
jgi:hypothetical protein